MHRRLFVQSVAVVRDKAGRNVHGVFANEDRGQRVQGQIATRGVRGSQPAVRVGGTISFTLQQVFVRKRRVRNSVRVKVKHSHLQATSVTVTNASARHRLEPVRILLRAVIRGPREQRRGDGFRLGLVLRPGQILQQRRIVPLFFQVLVRDRTFKRARTVAFQRGRTSGGGQHRLRRRRRLATTGDNLLRRRRLVELR